MSTMDDRYSRQRLFAPIGNEGQEKLRTATIGLIGLGALGSVIAEQLARAGVGRLIVVDRDFVESSNLHRQTLFTEEDAVEKTPKAIAAARRLSQLNAEIMIEAHVVDFNASNAEELLADADLLIDGTDNFSTRYLLNDLACEQNKPWIYGACVASGGLTATIIPGRTPCLTCLFPEPPPHGTSDTCDTVGIIAPAAHITASLQVTETLKWIVGDHEALRTGLLSFELWPFRLAELGKATHGPRSDCPTCVQGNRRYLHGETQTRTLSLCGRNAVQVLPSSQGDLDLEELAARLAYAGEVSCNGAMVTLALPDHSLSIFADGRALIRGTSDLTQARTLYDRFVGS